MGKKVVLAGACRTAVGVMGGALSSTPAAQLGTIVIKEAIKRAGIKPEDVQQVYMGCVIQAGCGQNVARQAAVYAGIPVESPAITVNVLCGSGLESVNMAARMVRDGEADVVIAGGTENMSMAPYLLDKARFGYRMGHAKLYDSMIKDALTDVFGDYHMGMTAENICDDWKLTREELDAFSASSQQKAVAAQEAGYFDKEIVGVEVKHKKDTIIFNKDEGPRQGVTVESLSKLKPAFKKDGGLVTAGNASGINDGAAAVVVMSEEKAKELGVKPQAEWIDGVLAGVEPRIMGIGPVAATKKLLAKIGGLEVKDFDLVEANEAFAAQSVAVGKELNWIPERLNISGGAIALGHPVGASGCRILVTLLYGMERTGAKTGLATLCVGGGMGCAAAVKAYEA